ncbi:MAG: hypothetical protein G01um101449_192 [Parcubacteria group bacterium Gr01-1014_49]|nr:MAG: hypothetical protein G01um101449_192 [Parcubacteria group bacterium Gr01-1014_49]
MRERRKKPRVLLATTEDEAAVSAPGIPRIAEVGAEPQLTVIVLHVEDVEADAASDGFHCDTEPFILGLVAVLQAQCGADFVGAELEAKLDCLGADVRIAGTFVEAEVADRQNDEVEVNFFLGAGNPAEDFVAQVADAPARRLQRPAVLIGRLAGAELHRLPDGKLDWLGHRDDQFAAQETQCSLFAAKFVDDSFHLTQIDFAVFHFSLLQAGCPLVPRFPRVEGLLASLP